ncbi:MAG: hypothetical protein RSD67_05945 [Oscillospiraceae bacterium]
MIKILDIIYALSKKFKEQMPSAKHYIGNLSEGHNTPCFLYLIVYCSDRRKSYYTKQSTLDLQIIYFEETDGYQKSDVQKQIECMDKLKEFLSSFILPVADRVLSFDYNFGKADERLSINIKFVFSDDIILPKEKSELAGQIIYTTILKD